MFFSPKSKPMEKSSEKRILAQRYEDDDEFSLLIRSILALAFVPEEDVADAFFTDLKLISEKHIPTSTASIMCWDYFEDNYIGRTRRGRPHAQPKFPIALWNVESRTEEDLPFPRINNNV